MATRRRARDREVARRAEAAPVVALGDGEERRVLAGPGDDRVARDVGRRPRLGRERPRACRGSPKPPSDWPSATTACAGPDRRCRPRGRRAARAAATRGAPAPRRDRRRRGRAGASSRRPGRARRARRRPAASRPSSAASQLSRPRPCASKSRSCSSRTPSEAPIGSSVHCACARRGGEREHEHGPDEDRPVAGSAEGEGHRFALR